MAYDLDIPNSTSTASTFIIHTNDWAYKVPRAGLFYPSYKGLNTFDLCSYSFLISHREGEEKQNILFDLGIQKDWENYTPAMVDKLEKWGTDLQIGQQVSENLEENSFDLADMDAMIWSHLHWDHTESPALFPRSTKLIFGPGIADKFMPGWPTIPNGQFRESDLARHEVVGLEKYDLKLTVRGFETLDYFSDGSLYILNAPGVFAPQNCPSTVTDLIRHSIGYLNALARATCNPDTFILLTADNVHLGGEFRLTEALPLPDPIRVQGIVPCPCAAEKMLEIHPLHAATQPFLGSDPSLPEELQAAEKTIELLQKFDADERVLVVFSRDTSIFDILEYYPMTANDWKARGWKQKGLWTFLPDIQQSVAKG